MKAEREEYNKEESPGSRGSGALSRHLKELGKHGAIYGLGSMMSRLVGFLLIPLYAHFLTPADYGVLQLIYITTETVAIISGLKLSVAMFRLYHEADTPGERNAVISTALIGGLGLGVLLIGPLLLISPWLAGFILEGEGQGVLFRIAVSSLCLQFPSSIVMSYLQIKERSLLYVGITTSRLIVSVGLNIYFVVVLRSNVIGILMAGLLIDVVSSAILIPWVFSRCGFHFSPVWFREMIQFGLPLVPGSLASMVTHASDRYFIRAYLSVAAAGVYSLGYKMGSSIHSFFYVPFGQIWNSRRFVIEKEPEARRIYAKVCTYFIGIMSFVGLGMSLFAKDIIMIISSDKYWDSAGIIPFVVLSYVVYSLEDHVSTGSWLKKRTGGIGVVVLVSGAVNIGLNFVLIPLFGMYGAVLSTLLSFLMRNVGLYYLSNQLYPIPFEWGRLSTMFLVGILLYVISTQIASSNLSLNLFLKWCLWISYPIFLWFGKVIQEEEKSELRKYFMKARNRLLRGRYQGV